MPNFGDRDKRVAAVARWISRGYSKSAIKRALAEKFSEVSPRTVEDYIRDAKTILLEDADETEEDLKAESLSLYRSIKRKSKNQFCVLKAQERIDKLYGLEKPTKTAQTKADGSDLPELLTPEQAHDELKRFVDSLIETAEQRQAPPADGVS